MNMSGNAVSEILPGSGRRWLRPSGDCANYHRRPRHRM